MRPSLCWRGAWATGAGDKHTHVELDPGFLRRGISLSPLRLKFEAGLQAALPDPFEGLHGLFADSLPDGWGRLLMDRLLRQRGIEPHAVSPLDRLAMVRLAGNGRIVVCAGHGRIGLWQTRIAGPPRDRDRGHSAIPGGGRPSA